MAATMMSILSGATFGAALIAAGVYSPSVIIGQLQLRDYHMLKTFLAASASSAIAIILANKYNISSCSPRTPATVNLFSPFDGNILGGTILGFGMALTGACPGTLIPQLIAGVRSGPLVLLGGLLGGILYSRFGKPLLGKVQDRSLMVKPTVFQMLEMKQGNATAIYEALCLVVIGSLTHYFPDEQSRLVSSVAGGMLIGLSQGASLLFTGGTLGISGAYEQLGDLFWWVGQFALEGRKKPRPSFRATFFALGTVLGSWGLFNYLQLTSPSSELGIGSFRAVFGGILLTFGSRIAGGCTSGHGISGMSQLSVASIITVTSMFGGGVALAAFIG
ncbi:YeeE/YedE family protein [Diplocarpon rosae]|nr:YeeE/YedE family protein [Diplocarpon rosae]